MEINSPFPDIKKPKKKVRAAKVAVKSLVYAFAIFGLLFLITIFSFIGMFAKETGLAKPVPPKAILTVDFSKGFAEVRDDDLLLDFAGMQSISYYDLVNAIAAAADDDRVKILVANVDTVELGLAQVQDLRKVIKKFSASGKKTIAFSRGFGAFGGGTKSYYLASAFDEIWMQPSSEIGITGIHLEVPFFKDLFDKLGVEPEFYTRHEYKSAAASFMETGFTPEHKAELQKMTESIFNQLLVDISEDRSLSVDELRNLIDEAPLFVGNTKDENNKLIDKVAYYPQMVEQIHKEIDGYAVALEDYVAYVNTLQQSKENKIVLLAMEGVINSGYSKSNPLGERVIGSDTITEQLDEIIKDKSVKALVVRVNSPGGSYGASNEIWNAIMTTKKRKDIPVVVSMSDYAASGGYFVALAGDYVYAEPSTITGSIGVLGGKFVLSELWQKLGVNWQEVSIGRNSGTLTFNRRFSDSEREVFNRSLDNVYKDFTTKVAAGRGIYFGSIDEIARGRVWTGSQAVEINLVNELGGLSDAVAKAKELAEIDGKYSVVYYPKKKTLQEKIAEVMNNGVGRVEAKSFLDNIGIKVEDLRLLKRLENDAVLAPFKLLM